MNINLIYPSKYVKAADLGDKNVTVTIKSAVMEELGYGAEKERKLVVYFEKATKGLILNRTNAMIIASMYTPETDNWIGSAIILYAARVKAFGSWHDAVRVKEQVPPRNVGAAKMPDAMQEAPPLDDEDDLLDVDEGQDDAHNAPTPAQQPSTPALERSEGSPENDPARASVLWEVEPEKPRATADQLATIGKLGVQVYGAQYNSTKLAQWKSKGAVSSLDQLLETEASALIKALNKKISDDAVEAVKAAQPPLQGRPAEAQPA